MIFSTWPIIRPGLWHICWADGQEGRFSMSVKPEGDCRVLGRIAQVHWPPGSQTQGEGRGRLSPRRTQRAPSMSGAPKVLGGVTH